MEVGQHLTAIADSQRQRIVTVKESGELIFNGLSTIPFVIEEDIVFEKDFLPFHANGIRFTAILRSGEAVSETYYSIGGGFVVKEERINSKKNRETFKTFPFPIQTGKELLQHCKTGQKSISEIVSQNELSLRTEEEIDEKLRQIADFENMKKRKKKLKEQ